MLLVRESAGQRARDNASPNSAPLPVAVAGAMSDGVDIKTLTAAQLQVLGEQLEEELGTLSDSFGKLQQAVSRFYQSGIALEAFAAEKEGACLRACVACGTRGRRRRADRDGCAQQKCACVACADAQCCGTSLLRR
jgi:hypothetical protein